MAKNKKIRDLLDNLGDNPINAEDRKLLDQLIYYSQKSNKKVDERVKNKIWKKVSSNISEIDKPKKNKSLVWHKVAASLVLIATLAIVVANYSNTESEIEYITKSTALGQKRSITLTDGTKIQLNAGSSIIFPKTFKGLNQRKVSLTGEAYFDVTHNKKMPFIIESGKLSTIVLGTSFNVNAYDSSAITVSLVSGKVRLDVISQNKSIFLKPGERGVYEKEKDEIEVTDFDISQLIAWKDGIVFMSRASQKEVFEQLERWYGVTFEFANQPKVNWKYSGEFKEMSLDEVLKIISLSHKFDYEIQGKLVKISFKN